MDVSGLPHRLPVKVDDIAAWRTVALSLMHLIEHKFSMPASSRDFQGVPSTIANTLLGHFDNPDSRATLPAILHVSLLNLKLPISTLLTVAANATY